MKPKIFMLLGAGVICISQYLYTDPVDLMNMIRMSDAGFFLVLMGIWKETKNL